MTTIRREKAASGARRSTARVAPWLVAIVLPVIAGGIVGGPIGGVVTAALLIPWLDHLLGRQAVRPENRDPGDVRAVRVVRVVRVDEDGIGPAENVLDAA